MPVALLPSYRGVFSFLSEDEPCQGLDHVLSRYHELVSHVELAGPTSFAPVIYKAIEIVKANQGEDLGEHSHCEVFACQRDCFMSKALVCASTCTSMHAVE